MDKSNPTQKLSDWPELERRIADVNKITTPESGWAHDNPRPWSSEQYEEYLQLIDNPRFKSAVTDRQNLIRLIEIAERADTPVGHTLRDDLSVYVHPSGALELFYEGLVYQLIRSKLPVNRFKVCPACGDIFWMKTKRSETCGKKACSDTLGNIKRARKK